MAEVKATKKTKAHLDAEKKIDELEKSLKSSESMKEYYQKLYGEANATLEGLHAVLTDLGIKEYADETQRYTKLPLTVRLFSWAMKLASVK